MISQRTASTSVVRQIVKDLTRILTIDIGSPVVEAATSRIAESPCFGADSACNSLNKRVVERGTHEDGLRKRGRITEIPRLSETNAGAYRKTVLRNELGGTMRMAV